MANEASKESCDYVKKILPPDPSLFDELLTNKPRGNTEIDKLVKRLKLVCDEIGQLDLESGEITADIQSLASVLVQCLWKCAENIHISKAIEKVLTLLWTVNFEHVVTLMTSHLNEALTTSDVSKGLEKVTYMLDISPSIRAVLEGEVPKLILILKSELSHILKKQTGTGRTAKDNSDLYISIKLSLQIFQYYPGFIAQEVWLEGISRSYRDSLTTILSGLISVLKTPGWSSDCVLLSGTTLMFFFNSATTVQSTSKHFWHLFDFIDKKEVFHIGHLQVSCEDFPQKKAVESFNFTLDTDFGLHHLSLIRGFIMTATTTTLLHFNTELNNNGINIVRAFSPIYQLCKGQVQLRYLSFQLMTKWFQKLLQLLPKMTDSSSVKSLTDSCIMSLSWDLVKSNCDSPVDNVAEFSIGICGMLMDVHNILVSKGLECGIEAPITMETGLGCGIEAPITMETASVRTDLTRRDLLDVILSHVITTPWTLKSRYKLLKLLVPYTNTSKILSQYPMMMYDIMKCLSTSNLAVCANDVYKACIIQIRDAKDNVEPVWLTQWWKLLESAITSELSLLRQNAIIYLIPTTLKTVPELVECLKLQITTCLESTVSGEDRKRALLAWVSVMKVIRSVKAGFDVAEIHLSSALMHSDDLVRSEAISVLCTSLKTAEPLSPVEETLLRSTLPHNLNIDSPSFRQKLTGDVKKLCIRCRDSCLAGMKSVDSDVTDRTLVFLDWLLKLCVSNIKPGSSFQRRKTCLEILQILLQVFTKGHESKQKRGQDLGTLRKIMDLAQERDQLSFHSVQVWVSVLHCVLDGTDEVQNLASSILWSHFCCLPSELERVDSVCQVLSHGLNLCNTAWSPDNNSGMLLCELVCKQYICDEGWVFSIKYCPARNHYIAQFDSVDKKTSVVKFLQFLLTEIEESLRIASQSPVQGSQLRPIQGLFKLLNGLLGVKFNIKQYMEYQHLSSLISKIRTLSLQTCKLMAVILAGGDNSDSCVSFADIASSLESLLPCPLPKGNQVNTSEDMLHSSYRPLLTWCATNTKECMVCLGRIVQITIEDYPDDLDLNSMLENLGSEFVSVFVRNRHWGAIEGCRIGFTKYCTSLFTSPVHSLCSLPKELLKQVLSNLTSTSSGSSVTRRSAGLPILLQTVLLCEKTVNQTECLSHTVETLLSVATSELPEDFDQTQDLPQVHAINILNTLFTDVGLVILMVPYIGRALILVIHGFSADNWAIRNSATQLFSTLITRVFGQRTNPADCSYVNSMTMTEFCNHYPELCPLITYKLEAARKSGLHSIANLPTVLFPILTILSHLAPETNGNSFSDSIRETVCDCAYSPVYSLRELAAKAYTALLRPSDRLSTILNILHRLSHRINTHCTNYLHGSILQLDKLIQIHSTRNPLENDIMLSLLNVDWLLFDNTQSCDLVRAKYVEVLAKSWRNCITGEVLRQRIQNCSNKIIKYVENDSKDNFMIGEWLYQENAVKLFLLVSSSDHLQTSLSSLLMKNSPLKWACVQTLSTSIHDQTVINQHVCNHIQRILLSELQDEKCTYQLSHWLNLILCCHDKYGLQLDDITNFDLSPLTLAKDLYPNSMLSAQILEVSAIWIKHHILKGTYSQPDIDDLSEKILRCSDSSATEHHQKASAKALYITGAILFSTQYKKKEFDKTISRLVEATWNLLHNVQSEVRVLTGKFVTSLSSPQLHQTSGLQTSVCIQIFCDYLVAAWAWSDVCVQSLATRLYTTGEMVHLLKHNPGSSGSDMGGRERYIEAYDIIRTLKSMCTRRTEVLSESLTTYFSHQLEGVVVDLETLISHSVSHADLFSMLTTPVILSHIIEGLLVIDFIININMRIVPDIKHRVKKVIEELNKVTTVHCFLGEILCQLIKDFP